MTVHSFSTPSINQSIYIAP